MKPESINPFALLSARGIAGLYARQRFGGKTVLDEYSSIFISSNSNRAGYAIADDAIRRSLF